MKKLQISAILLLAALEFTACGKVIKEEPTELSTTTQTITSMETSWSTESPSGEDKQAEIKETYVPVDAKITDGATVSIVKSKEKLAADIEQPEIESMVKQALSYSGEFESLIKNGQTVVIKPNLVQMKVDSTGQLLDKTVNGITTDWRVTNAVVQEVRALNPDGKVYIVEGSATGPTSEIMKYYNYTPEYIKGVNGFISLEEDCGAWQDFNAPEIVKVSLAEGLLHKEYYFNKILYEADVLISIPCLKTSSGVVVTAGIKNVSLGAPPGNLYGVSATNPGKTNMVSHKIVDGELDKWIYDYFMCKKIDFVILDGLQGFQSGPVPMSGERAESDKMNMGIIIAGKDAVAVDTVCALITGWDSESVGYLRLFNENGIGVGDLSKIYVHGGYVDDLRKNFTIKRPDLGGVQITDTSGPEFTLEGLEIVDGNLNVELQAAADSVKSDIYIDDIFYMQSAVKEGSNSISIDVSKLNGKLNVNIFVYDRFLNKTLRTAQIELN